MWTSDWQTIFAGIGAAGTIGAALVAWRALKYFKSQTDEMKASNTATREQMEVQERRWEDEQRRELRRAHAVVRPEISVQLGDYAELHTANEFGAAISFAGGKAVRDVTASVALEGRDVAGECVPPGWPETGVGGRMPIRLRASGAAAAERATLVLTYLAALGARVTYMCPLRITNARPLEFARDVERIPETTDDPFVSDP